MESVKNLDEINNLKENKIEGLPNLTNSTIIFKGKNNILYCENDVNIISSTISFEGDNSLIYLSSTKYNYPVVLVVFSDSTVFIGKDNSIFSPLNISVQEAQNLVIGDDCIISSGVNIRTSDAHPIYKCDTKKRINFSESILIGDHVWLGHLAYISRGVNIGSGSIISNASFLSPLTKVPSNSYMIGNPSRLIENGVFFTKDYVGRYNNGEILDSADYKSNVYIYDYVERETLSFQNIDNILKDLSVNERLEFIIKLFVKNKRKNRFVIK